MPKRVIWMLISGVIAATILSIILKEIQWGPLVGIILGVYISEYYREKEGTEEIETDERVNNNIKQFMIFIFSLSYTLLIIYLLMGKYVVKQGVAIEPLFLILYLLCTLFIAFFIGPYFIKRK
ncbi:hypothetical protein GCM10028778_20960 [Barrientosiimonas marina]|uniref:DUF2178 domain-containing protein n=1 Tax=Lentibacillus kimchii TaxID=1542911 RepID=A0ABW2UTQ1_9BACI